MSKKILILGSANIDHISKVKHIPKPGETVGDGVYSKAFGGKGFNQAVASVKAGGNVSFIASVGDDEDGKQIIQRIGKDGANIDRVLFKTGSRTGAAFIFVEDSGENIIVVSPGANKELTVEEISCIRDSITDADYLVMQMEIPYDCVQTAANLASECGTFVLLNPAPACRIAEDLLALTDLLVVNETEAEIITGKSFNDTGNEDIARELMRKGVKSVIVTLGAGGSYYMNGEMSMSFPAYKVNAVDTTAAGDTFCGSLITFLAENISLPDAIKMASAASALAVQKLGAYPSIPTRDEIENFLAERD